MKISIALITLNEEANLPRTLESVTPLVRDGEGEIIVVDSGSTDRTLEIARSHGAKVFVEPWKGFAAQKNSAMEKATADWVLQLDADEALEPELADEISRESDYIKRCKRTSAHRKDVGKRVGGRDLPVGKWVVHNRREKIYGLHESAMSIQAINAAIIESFRAHEHVPA